jgi:transcriptional regulator with XRE-family HTH domain
LATVVAYGQAMARTKRNDDLALGIGQRIKTLREERGLTQERLAWACDINKSFLSMIEAGRRLPSLTVLASLAAEMQVELPDLVVVRLDAPHVAAMEAIRLADAVALKKVLRDIALVPIAE